MGCEFFGRTFDPDHPVCSSCRSQGVECTEADLKNKMKKKRESRRVRATAAPGVNSEGKKNLLVRGYDLDSPNKWIRHPNSRKIYMGVKRKWKGILSNSGYHFGKAEGKRQIYVIRHIKDRRSLYDEDNMVGSLKPLIDSLVKEGVFIDDKPQYLQVNKPVQIPDGQKFIEIIVEELND